MGSIWDIAGREGQPYPALQEDIEVDVAVIGGGITGLTAALRLAEAGKSVTVLEALKVGNGSTGGSTGNLYSTLAKGLATVAAKWGDDAARDVVAARAQAIDFVEETVQRFGLDCQFHRRPLYRILPEPDARLAQALDAERDALERAGLRLGSGDDAPLPFDVHRGLKLEDQAQFNPLRYVQGLAAAVIRQGGVIHEHSQVRKADYDRGVVQTDQAEVRAQSVVAATHTPKGINILQSGMLPSREYGVSAKLRGGPYPDGIFWVLDPFHSIRSYRFDGEDYLVLIGEQHKTGETKQGAAYYERLCDYLRLHFDVQSFEHQWSAQQYSSADGLPYIGRMPGGDNAYLATGFAADGLTWGTVGGMLISDLILERDNPWRERFDAKRFTPVKSAREWMKENLSVSKHLAQDYLGPAKLKQFESVPVGEGRIVSVDGERLAVYRAESGELSVLSGVCPHMKCLVHWNAADASWDCPCHGSRFATDGSVLEGPAFHPLGRRSA